MTLAEAEFLVVSGRPGRVAHLHRLGRGCVIELHHRAGNAEAGLVTTKQRIQVTHTRMNRPDAQHLSETSAGPETPLLYRLKLRTAEGVLLREDSIRADTDEEAVRQALRRLVAAAIIEVWRHARWVAQVQRPVSLQ